MCRKVNTGLCGIKVEGEDKIYPTNVGKWVYDASINKKIERRTVRVKEEEKE